MVRQAHHERTHPTPARPHPTLCVGLSPRRGGTRGGRVSNPPLRQAWVEVGGFFDAAEGGALSQGPGGKGEHREEVARDGAAVAELPQDELSGCAVEERADAGGVEGRHALGEQRRHDARQDVACAGGGQRGVGVGDDAQAALGGGDGGEGALQDDDDAPTLRRFLRAAPPVRLDGGDGAVEERGPARRDGA